MPNRIIKDSICTSDTINALSPFAECVFYRLLMNCDDFGRIDARPIVVLAKCYPIREDIERAQITAAVDELLSAGVLERYTVAGKAYLHFPKWFDHQRCRASHSKYPAPEGWVDPRPNSKQRVQNDSNSPSNDSNSQALTNTKANAKPNTNTKEPRGSSSRSSYGRKPAPVDPGEVVM